jgi:hypothetical protein
MHFYLSNGGNVGEKKTHERRDAAPASAKRAVECVEKKNLVANRRPRLLHRDVYIR